MSSKTPKARRDEIRSERNRRKFLAYILPAWLFAFTILLVLPTPNQAGKNSCPIKVDNRCINLILADDDFEREKGLSGRASLSADEGMIFVFEEEGKRCFWMKEMNFAIDMIWLNSEGIVQKVEENVQPESYPKSFCQDNSKYVIELNSGNAEKAGIKPGVRLDI